MAESVNVRSAEEFQRLVSAAKARRQALGVISVLHENMDILSRLRDGAEQGEND